MSLIRCEECGKEISDKACLCPYCGYPISGTCVVHVKWDNMKGNTFLKTTVLVDGSIIGEMKCSEILNFVVNPGSHRIDLLFRNKCVVSENIDIRTGQTDEYFAYRQTLTGLKRIKANSASWRSLNNNYGTVSIPRCPTCGSTNVKKITISRKVTSASILGIASGSVLKTFECKDCKYKW